MQRRVILQLTRELKDIIVRPNLRTYSIPAHTQASVYVYKKYVRITSLWKLIYISYLLMYDYFPTSMISIYLYMSDKCTVLFPNPFARYSTVKGTFTLYQISLKLPLRRTWNKLLASPIRIDYRCTVGGFKGV